MKKNIQPKIINRETFTVIGIEYCGKNKNNELTSLWNDFTNRLDEIKNNINPHIQLGFFDFSSKPNSKNTFSYIACAEVENLNNIPQGMLGKTIWANKYAVFYHPDMIEPIGKTYEYIYGTWLPNSDYEHGKAADFEMYKKSKDNSHIENIYIYVPIKDKF
jgi:AraC family transcriptional regulator